MPSLRISLLGPLTVSIDGTPAEFRTDALRVLLAYLAAHQGIPQRRDALAGILSPDRSDKDALTYLRNRLTRLRSSLNDAAATPPWLTVDRKQIALRTGDDIVIDVIQFEQHVATVENHVHRQLSGCPTCLERLNEASGLVRGEFLAGLNFPSDVWESWLLGQREHIQQRALEAMTWLRNARMERNEWDAVLDVAQRQLILEPWLEAAHRAIMQAHHQLGDRNASLAQYEQCQDVLREELGIEPEEETTALFQRLMDESAGDPLAHRNSPFTILDNLPLQTNRFFGRQAEQTLILERLVDPAYRLITLAGSGGMGKTRLAIEVGQQAKQSFSDGVWFVALGAVKGSAEQIKIAVGEAIGLSQDDKQLTGDQVQAILRDKQMLLIFDNCETVLDELGFIATWLNRVPQVVILATSREPLNFQSESVVLLKGLPIGTDSLTTDLPNTDSLNAAEAMFAEQGRMSRDGFTVTDENLAQVRQICHLVDGLPLGIALAAAWVRRRSLPQIIDSIDQSLDFLSTRMRDVDPRHRSMRAVFEASWQMLASEEQEILATLSVFSTSFTAEAAEQVAEARFFDLDLLCEKSLLQQQPDRERYSMHSLVRQFAAEKMVVRKREVEEAFVDYYFEYARKHQENYDRLKPEWRNFSVAISKAHELEAWQTVLGFVLVLDEPWFRQIRFGEMRVSLPLALGAAIALGDEDALAQTLLRLGEVEIELSDYEVAETHLDRALNYFLHLEESAGIAQAKYFLGRLKMEQAEDEQAVVLFSDSKRIFEDEEDWLGIARNLNLLAHCQIKMQRNFETAHTYLKQSADLQRRCPLSPKYVETLRYLARVKTMSEAYTDAERCLIEATDISRQQADIGEYAAVLYERLLLSKKRNQIDQALAFGYESLENFRKLGSLRWEALIKTQLGLLYQAKQELQQGLDLLRGGLQIFQELGDMYEQAYSYYYLSKLYMDIDEVEQSLYAKEFACRLNLELNDPLLTAWLKQ
ncbi:MAG: BTAD domain-containing putative transcriptional regulator [Chloroflexota bacterium]